MTLPGKFPAAINTRSGLPIAAAIIIRIFSVRCRETAHALESLESTFGQDLNGDGVIGLPRG